MKISQSLLLQTNDVSLYFGRGNKVLISVKISNTGTKMGWNVNHTFSIHTCIYGKSLKLVVVAFPYPLGAQDYGNSTTAGPPESV